MDNLHSIYVDQWDWEKVINLEDRTMDYLKETVKKIVFAICSTEKTLHSMYPTLNRIPLTEPEIIFITTQELEDLYPDLTPKERENAFVKEHHTRIPDADRRQAEQPASPTTAERRTTTTGI